MGPRTPRCHRLCVQSTKSGMGQPIIFATLGTFLIDNVIYADEGLQERHLGGGGLWAAAGARIWLPLKDVFLSARGSRDGIPEDMVKELRAISSIILDEYLWLQTGTDSDSILQSETKYKARIRSFRHLNPRPFSILQSFPSTSPVHTAKYLHFCCSPEDLSTSLEHISTYQTRPVVVYEPMPISCTPSRLDALKRVLPSVNIFSPNHEEIGMFLSESYGDEDTPEDIRRRVERLTRVYHDYGAKSIVVRAGAQGSYVSNMDPAFGKVGCSWLPAYWTSDEALQVKNTTGAGNSFLGGLCAGMNREENDVVRAAAYGSVSASFAIQQAEVPIFGHSEDGAETWNGEHPRDRLRRYL
ncbi:pfkb family carbohydrate kinase superfamily [Moniliophthora roreri MCA 2997]|uniref:Pfkb family carbohydrate kinase superfamily n=2 Tax=Moniliophthora roreri TaxID=221103 RepID=V2WT74_MONRO|nr:pfkb family carbohydrate kinase superfamily [Moniliophthora roreri MCA 2997]KAI3613770.1 pfkb family carbohydrate kinase superfamily [Moniliophthora roreri]